MYTDSTNVSRMKNKLKGEIIINSALLLPKNPNTKAPAVNRKWN